MHIKKGSTRDVGDKGELLVCTTLQKAGYTILDRNVLYKTGEIDIVAKKGGTLHFVEVKTVQCDEFPHEGEKLAYSPASNIHAEKVRKVARTGEWYVAHHKLQGDWQIDAALVWVRRNDERAKVVLLKNVH